MGRFVKGEVIVVPFPFSDLTGSKPRPALVLASLAGDDVVLCQITSQQRPGDSYSIPLVKADFERGSLPMASYIRPNRLFTADSHIVIRCAGTITTAAAKKVESGLRSILGI